MLKWLKRKIDFFSLGNMLNEIEEMQDMLNNNNKIRCQYCGSLLPFFKLVLKAKSVKNLEYFYVECRKCKHVNQVKKEFGNDQCKFCGKVIYDSGNICNKCFKRHVRVSEK